MIINLGNRLEKWVAQGLLSAVQADEIQRFEERSTSRPWVLYGVAAIGVTAIVTGIVSIIAANWDAITPTLKLVNYFVLQSAVGAFIYWADKREKSVGRELGILGFVLLLFGGIGLVAQVFHLDSESWRGLLFWVVLAMPLMLLARTQLVSHLWIFGLFVTAFEWSDYLNLNRFGTYATSYDRQAVATALPFLLAAVGFLLRERLALFSRASLFWGLGAIVLVGSYGGNALWLQGYRTGFWTTANLSVMWVATIFAAAASLARTRLAWSQRLTTAALLVAATAYASAPLLISVEAWGSTQTKLIGAVGFLVIWAFAAAAAALSGHRRLFDVATLAIAIRFIVIYFEVFGTLSTTGFGLIASGLLILLVAYGWYRYRLRVQTLITGGVR